MRTVGILGVALVLCGCSSGVGRPVQEVKAITESDGVQHVRVVAHSFWFEPNRVVVKKGVPVEFKFDNGGFFVPHNFSCHSPDAEIMVSEDVGTFGRHKQTQFTPTKTGEFPFFCNKDEHAKKGMKGTLVVVE